MPRRPKYRLGNWYKTPKGSVKYTLFKNEVRIQEGRQVPKKMSIQPMTGYVARLFGGKK